MVRDCAGGRSGGIDDDLLMGDDGRDLLLGGEGNDTIFGGEGADRFVVLTQNSGYDVIQDFAIGEDILDLSFTKVRSFDDLVVGIQEDQIVIQGSDGSNISLLHLGESDLDLMNAAQARAWVGLNFDRLDSGLYCAFFGLARIQGPPYPPGLRGVSARLL